MKWFRVSLVAFCFFLAASLSVVPFAGADWSMYRANAAHTGVGTGGPIINPVILWNFSTNGTVGDPAVVGGVVYFGSEDGNVYAINSSDASMIWNCSVLKHVDYSTPAVADGYLLITSHDPVPELKNAWAAPPSITYYVDALDASNGKKLWEKEYPNYVGQPLLQDYYVYITAWSEIYALIRSSGILLWDNNNRGLFQTPAFANGLIYTGGINAFNQSTGQYIWYATEVGYEFPVVANDTVYAVGYLQNEIGAFNATTGDRLWNYPLNNSVRSSPAVANGAVYFGCDDGHVYALDGASGNQLWNYTMGSGVGGFPAVCGGVVYITCYSNLYALNASTGTQLWNFSGFSNPVVVDGVIYGGFGNRMYALVDSSALPQPTATPTEPYPISNWFPVTLVTIAIVVGTVIVIAALLVLRGKHRIKVKAEIATQCYG